MKRIIASIVAFILSLFSAFPGIVGNNNNFNESFDGLVKPETWAMTDGLGRNLPLESEAGEKDNTKFVGMFYWTWHTNFGSSLKAKNVTEILAEHPEIFYDFDSPIWESESFYPDGRPFFWNEPIWGYYSDLDEYVIRKNAELLADAGVDVIFFDCTNDTATWDNTCLKLFEVFEKAKKDGVNVPKMAYMLPFSNDVNTTTVSLKHLYNEIYSQGKYKDLWFMWDGKPMIMAHSSGLKKFDPLEKEILNFFTFRTNDPSYFTSDKPFSSKTWGWCSDYPQAKYGYSLNGRVEQMCVSVAQNAKDGKLSAQNAEGNVQGRSFTHGDFSYTYNYGGKTITVDKNIENSDFYGLNFQQQWDYAIECDPDFIFIDGWNEWIAGRWKEWEGTKNAFPDQFSDEHSRDIEPSTGRLKDYYYSQLAANIRRFKGVESRQEAIDGIKTYYHYENSTYNRNCDGWVGLHYTNETMRNDFVKAEVSNDNLNVYFKIYCKDNISPYTDDAWMRILIDTDTSGVSENWEGFEYIINRENADENSVEIEKSNGGWNFSKTGTATYSVSGNCMTVAVPLSALGLDSGNVHFNFKLSDNMQTDGDIMDFYLNGDVAPGSRFTFVY